MFTVGQHIEFIDDNIKGVIQKIEGTRLVIETEDGFLMHVQEKQIIASNDALFDNVNIDEASLREKLVTSKKPKTIVSKKKKGELPPMEVDLHIHQLTESTRGMNNYDMLNLQVDTARRQLEFAIRKRIPRIVFIHGVGEGVLKTELEFLFSRYEQVTHYDADYQKYGIGATEVKIFQNSAS